MTRFSVPYEEMEIIKIIIRVPSSLSLLVCSLCLFSFSLSTNKNLFMFSVCEAHIIYITAKIKDPCSDVFTPGQKSYKVFSRNS
jgi:hypothetical protein